MIFEQIDAGGDRNFSYLIGDEESRLCAVVDPGYDTSKLEARVKDLGLKVAYILNTHTHHDHVAGNDVFHKGDVKLAAYKEAGVNPDIKLEFPTPEAFGGTAIAFRQLHADDEKASFSRVKGLLMKGIKLLPESEQEALKDVVAQWAKARGKLMNNQLEYIVAKKVGKSDPHPAPDDFPFSYCNINPQKLILTFNYGDTIHFSGE